MDVTTARVAATQFTAYMALCNLVISYTAVWQGHAVTRWGYPITLTMDALFGLVCIVLLPFMRPAKGPVKTEETVPGIARPGQAIPEAFQP
jgi:hypothetical protein